MVFHGNDAKICGYLLSRGSVTNNINIGFNFASCREWIYALVWMDFAYRNILINTD